MQPDSTNQDDFKPLRLYTEASAKAKIPAGEPLIFADCVVQSAAGIKAIFNRPVILKTAA